MATFGLTATGLNLPRAADFIARVQARYEELTGEAPDWDRDLTIQNFLIAVADEFDTLSEVVQSIHDAMDENNATGAQLENIAAIAPGIDKKGPTSSQVSITIAGTAATVIASGAIVEFPKSGDRFLLSEDTTIPASGSIDAVFVAENPGAVQGPTGTYDIVTPVSGWDTATAALKASVGRATETDDELRVRRRLSMQVAGGNSLGALLGAVLALPFINDAVAIENDVAVPQTVDGVLLPANSFAIVVLPDPLTTDQATALVQLIHALAPMGIQSFGTETATAAKTDGGSKSIAYSFPTGQNVSTQVIYSVALGFDATTVQALVDTAVDEFFALLGPGDTVTRLAATRYVSSVVAGLTRLDIDFNGLVDTDVDVAATKVAVRTTTGSTITQAV